LHVGLPLNKMQVQSIGNKNSKIIKHLIYWSSEKCAQIFLIK